MHFGGTRFHCSDIMRFGRRAARPPSQTCETRKTHGTTTALHATCRSPRVSARRKQRSRAHQPATEQQASNGLGARHEAVQPCRLGLLFIPAFPPAHPTSIHRRKRLRDFRAGSEQPGPVCVCAPAAPPRAAEEVLHSGGTSNRASKRRLSNHLPSLHASTAPSAPAGIPQGCRVRTAFT